MKWICEPYFILYFWVYLKRSGNQDAQMAKQGAQIDLLVSVNFDMQTQMTNMHIVPEPETSNEEKEAGDDVKW